MNLQNIFRTTIFLVVFTACILGSWAFYFEPRSLTNSASDMVIEPWPAACDGLNVVVLADLHVGSPYFGLDKLETIVRETNSKDPDLILLAGDYVIHGVIGGKFVTPEPIARQLSVLRAKIGVYAVLGNHDWWYDAARITAAFAQNGIPVLEDASVQIGIGDCEFWLVGVSDFWEGAHDVQKALRGVPEGAPVIAFTHNPDVFVEIPDRVSLTVAGHTHGGQVSLPLVGRPVVPSRYGQRFAVGRINEGGRQMFVSQGLGTSIIPVRFRVPPEISVITLRAK